MIEYLKQLGIEIDPVMEKELLGVFAMESYSKKEFFHNEGKVCSKIAFILEGKIVHSYLVNGKEITRWVSLSESFITSFRSFLENTPSLDSLQCITPCRLLVASKIDFMTLKSKYPQLQKFWTEAIEREMSGSEFRVYQLIAVEVEEKIFELHPNFSQP